MQLPEHQLNVLRNCAIRNLQVHNTCRLNTELRQPSQPLTHALLAQAAALAVVGQTMAGFTVSNRNHHDWKARFCCQHQQAATSQNFIVRVGCHHNQTLVVCKQLLHIQARY